jgi:hypothetical protein
MPNIIIPIQHQSAPTQRYDPVLAREAAAAKDAREAGRRDWDAIDWEAANPRLARRAMVNQNFDREFDRPAHHDPALELLQQRAYLEQIERRPELWVEETLELHAANEARARAQRLDGQERWEGKERQDARMVNILHPNGVLRKLRAAGVDARNSESPHARIWLNDWTCGGLVGVNAWVRPQEMDDEGYLVAHQSATSQAQRDLVIDNFLACRAGRKVRKTLTSLQEPYGPEWSIMRFNDYGVATKERYRGWRTAMLVLIVAEVLTAEEVDAAFGPPIGEAGAWYRSQLQAWRQIKLGKAI